MLTSCLRDCKVLSKTKSMMTVAQDVSVSKSTFFKKMITVLRGPRGNFKFTYSVSIFKIGLLYFA